MYKISQNLQKFAFFNEHVLVIILQNIEKNKLEKKSLRKAPSKNISSLHKLSQYISQKLVILGDPLFPGNTLQV